jgi:hypothetical protein
LTEVHTGSSDPHGHLYGHAAYIWMDAMRFKATEIVKAFYSA